eukprot:12018557-Karenia_brevis.AAC.1
MSELSPAIEVTAAENAIREGQSAPSPILPKSVVKPSEAMHQSLLKKDSAEAAKLLGIDESGVPMIA